MSGSISNDAVVQTTRQSGSQSVESHEATDERYQIANGKSGRPSPRASQTRSRFPHSGQVNAHQNTARNDPTVSASHALSGLTQELLNGDGKISPSHIADHLQALTLAADAYQQRHPGTNRKQQVQLWLQTAFGHNPRLVALANKVSADVVREVEQRGNANRPDTGIREQSNVADRHLQTARLFQKLAQATVSTNGGAPLQSDAADSLVSRHDGQHLAPRLMTSDDLKVRLGTTAPDGHVIKKEVRTGVFGIVINNHYRGILNDLDDVHRELAETQLGESKMEQHHQALQLNCDLDELESKIEVYARRHPDRVAVMNELRDQIKVERQLIADVLSNASDIDRQAEHDPVLMFDSENVPYRVSQTRTWANTTNLMAMQAAVGARRTDNEQSLPQGERFAAGGIGSVDLVQYQDNNLMVFKTEKLMESEAADTCLKSSGIDRSNPRSGANVVAASILARSLNVNHLIPRAEFAVHNGRIGTVTPYAPGYNVNCHQLQFVEPDDNDKDAAKLRNGREMPDVIVRKGGQITDDIEIHALLEEVVTDGKKHLITQMVNGQTPIPSQAKLTLQRFAIDVHDDGTLHRQDQVVTNVLDHRELDQFADEQLRQAGFERLKSARVYDGSVGIRLDLQDANVRRNLCDAQWLGCAAYLGDPNMGNWRVQLDSQGRFAGLTLIDNDVSFGKRDAALLHDDATSAKQNEMLTTPSELPVISRAFKTALDLLNKHQLRRDLEGVLERDKIDDTMDWLDALQMRAQDLQQQGKVLEDDQWAGQAGTQFVENSNYCIQVSESQGVSPLLVARNEARLKPPPSAPVPQAQ